MPLILHPILGFVGALVSGVALWVRGPALLSGILVGMTNLYIIVILIEGALRAGKPRKYVDGVPQPTEKVLFEMPNPIWNFLQLLFIVFIVVTGFANMYLEQGGVHYAGAAEVVQQEISNESANANPPIPHPILTGRLDAVYYSMVTVVTLGYGDFVPTTEGARKLVIWELTSGLLVLIGAFPLLISRLALT